MEKKSELSLLELELASVQGKRRNQAWPERVREKVASGIREGKFSVQEASKATGIPKATVYSWARTVSKNSKRSFFGKRSFRQVKVSGGSEISVQGPKGFVIRGMCFEEVRSLLKESVL